MPFTLRSDAFIAASALALWTPVAARPSPDAVERDLDLHEERFINARSYKHRNSTVKLVGCKKMPVPHDGVDAFERGWYASLHEHEELGRHFYDASRHELRVYFPVENALVEHRGKLLEANELREFELDELDGDYAALGRYQTDAVRGVDANIIRDDLRKRCDEIGCPNQGCVKNHGGLNCSNKFNINQGRCPFRSDICMDFNGWFTDCVRHTDKVGRLPRFPAAIATIPWVRATASTRRRHSRTVPR